MAGFLLMHSLSHLTSVPTCFSLRSRKVGGLRCDVIFWWFDHSRSLVGGSPAGRRSSSSFSLPLRSCPVRSGPSCHIHTNTPDCSTCVKLGILIFSTSVWLFFHVCSPPQPCLLSSGGTFLEQFSASVMFDSLLNTEAQPQRYNASKCEHLQRRGVCTSCFLNPAFSPSPWPQSLPSLPSGQQALFLLCFSAISGTAASCYWTFISRLWTLHRAQRFIRGTLCI